MKKSMTVLVLALVAAVAAPVIAQEQVRVGSRVGTPPSGYENGSRRDPFVSLISVRKVATTTARPVSGALSLSGVSVTDIKVTGIQRFGANVTAMLETPDGKTFVAHVKDRLSDAVVKTIDAEGVVFTEQVTDVIGTVRSREIRKGIRSSDGGGR